MKNSIKNGIFLTSNILITLCTDFIVSWINYVYVNVDYNVKLNKIK